MTDAINKELTYFSPSDKKVPNAYFLQLKIENQNIIIEFERAYIFDYVNNISNSTNQTQKLKANVKYKSYADGASFFGQMETQNQSEQKSGKGIYRYAHGDIYCGDWRGDQFNGKGTYIFRNQERYEGDLLNGMKNGKGIYFYLNQNTYDGEWENDEKNGQGTHINLVTNEIYKGAWKDGEKNGSGLLQFQFGDQYIGNFKNGLKHGTGKIFYIDGLILEASWIDDVLLEDQKVKIQKLRLTTNDKQYQQALELEYIGGFLNSKMNQYGEYTHYDHQIHKQADFIYKGNFNNNKFHKQGLLITNCLDDRCSYEGQFVNGLKSGQGLLKLNDNGGIFTGQFENDQIQGYGLYLMNNGDAYQGQICFQQKQGNGKYYYSNGDIYSGQFKDNKMHGEGDYYFMSKQYPELQHKGHSRAADATSFFIPELNILLDAGMVVSHKSGMNPEHYFLTHLHTDHSCGIAYNIKTHLPNKQIKQLYVPYQSTKLVQDYVNSQRQMNYHSTLDQSYFDSLYTTIGMQHDQTVNIIAKKRTLLVKSLELSHSIPCVLYAFSEVRKKLKQEFVGKTTKEIGTMKQQGVIIDEQTEIKLFVFCGDTTVEPILQNWQLLQQYKLIFIECSFIEDNEEEVQRARKKKHMHWNEIAPIMLSNPQVEFCLIHFSLRYTDTEINQFIKQKQSGGQFLNVKCWVDQSIAQLGQTIVTKLQGYDQDHIGTQQKLIDQNISDGSIQHKSTSSIIQQEEGYRKRKIY